MRSRSRAISPLLPFVERAPDGFLPGRRGRLSMALLELRSSLKLLNPPDPRRAACVRTRPECVVLGVMEGVAPSDKPPVRIFLGTEPGQYRAERVLVWSIEQARDPSRVYEIHLMKDLVGFDRRGWTTGFTNYRFAVPHLAGGHGRAIYNDVDEAYTGDPAELFDLDMGGHGYLSTSESETSVMLIDCERMAPNWPLDLVQKKQKKQVMARTREVPGIRGNLPPEWTARDEEYAPGFSKLQHWTTLQTQPWRPVPRRFVYQPNPVGQLWFDIKHAADAAGYQVFTAERPSSLYQDLVARLRAAPRRARCDGPDPAGLRALVATAKTRSLLELVLDGAAGAIAAPNGMRASRHDLAAAPDARGESFDAAMCTEVLEYLPDEDVPWVVDALFARARKFVYAQVGNDARGAVLSDGSRLASHPRPWSWWCEHFEAAGRRNPDLYWRLELASRDRKGRAMRRVRDGGRRVAGPPAVWVLVDERPENAMQAVALADALGWPYERKELRAAPWGGLPGVRSRASCRAVDRASRAALCPPWPDIVVAAGRCTAPVARWIRARTFGRTRLVQVGREGGEAAERFDAVVTPAYAHLWPHPRRIETTTLLTPSEGKRLARTDAVEVERGEDAIVVPGDDEAQLALAAASGRPFRVAPVPPPSPGPARRLRDWMRREVTRRANQRPTNRRGTARPQQGLEYLCARLVERGIVSPPVDLGELHETLYRLRIAVPPGAPVETGSRLALRETDEVATRVLRLLGCWPDADGPARSAP